MNPFPWKILVCLLLSSVFFWLNAQPIPEKENKKSVQSYLAELSQWEKSQERPVFLVVSFLQSPYPQVRSKAARLLGKWKATEAIPFLRLGLLDSDKWVRASCVGALGEFFDESCRKDLLLALKDPEWEVRCAAIVGLSDLPYEEETCKKLRDILESSDPHWQIPHTAALALGKFPNAENLAILHKVLDQATEHELVLAGICRALGMIRSPSSLPFLLRAIKTKKERVLWESNQALSQIAAMCIPELVEVFSNKAEAEEVRDCAGSLLGRIPAPVAAPVAYRIAQDESESGKMRHLALILLSGWEGKKASSLFLTQLKSNDFWVRKGSMMALVCIQEPKALPEFIEMLRQADEYTYEGILQAIASLEIPEVEQFVLQELASPSNENLCVAAIRLAGTIPVLAALPHLQAMKQKPETWKHLQKRMDWAPILEWSLQQMRKP